MYIHDLVEISFSVPNEHWADLCQLPSYLRLKDHLYNTGIWYTVDTLYADDEPYLRTVTIRLTPDQETLLKKLPFFKRTMEQVERWNQEEGQIETWR